jgi:hypothetical protein
LEEAMARAEQRRAALETERRATKSTEERVAIETLLAIVEEEIGGLALKMQALWEGL